ncbi:LacI family DNA-binding transcriptional regulator [Kineococcus sp. SYSU DK002]|uniref:LacI family DNA-binding transcriptional regulator n=1 Tax=Kineococcus sp. SYSU DK002 TaxID=3383123 RepID=UPI003D7DBAEC
MTRELPATAWTAGVVVVRPDHRMGSESFVHDLLAGMEQRVQSANGSLLLRIATSPAEEEQVYRRWAGAGTVSAVILLHIRNGDSRLALLRELGLPTLVVGNPEGAHTPAVWSDHAEAIRLAVTTLVDLGHRCIGRVAGPSELRSVTIRSAAFDAVCAELGVSGVEVHADLTQATGRSVTLGLLRSPELPTAIVFDNDLMALGGLEAATDAGLRVPDDVSLLSWDDSALTQLARPPLSTVGLDVEAAGQTAAAVLIDLIGGVDAGSVRLPRPTLTRRRSLGASPR